MAKRGQVKILHPDWCKGCSICIEVCPVDVLGLEKGRVVIKDLQKCTGCMNCELACPDYVLKVVKDNG